MKVGWNVEKIWFVGPGYGLLSVGRHCIVVFSAAPVADAHLRLLLGAVAVVVAVIVAVAVAFLGSLVCIDLANSCFNGSSGEESLKVGMGGVAIDTVRSNGTELAHSILHN